MIRRSALNLNFQAGIARGDESVTTTSLLRRVRIAVTEAEKQEIGVLSWNEVKDPGAQPKTFGKIVSMGYMEQISLASLALSSRIVSTETVMISLHRQNPISWPICPMRSVLL